MTQAQPHTIKLNDKNKELCSQMHAALHSVISNFMMTHTHEFAQIEGGANNATISVCGMLLADVVAISAFRSNQSISVTKDRLFSLLSTEIDQRYLEFSEAEATH